MDDQISLKGCRRVSGACFYDETITIPVNRSYGRAEPDVDACCPGRLHELVHKVWVEPDQRGRTSVQNASLGSGTVGNVSELKGNVPAADKQNTPGGAAATPGIACLSLAVPLLGP